MPNINITADGLIHGGVAEKEFAHRQDRLSGAWALWARYRKGKHFTTAKSDRIKIIKHPRLSLTTIMEIGKPSAQYEIGAWRCKQDVIPKFGRRWFRFEELDALIKKECAPVSDGVGMLAGAPPFVQADDIYQARLRDRKVSID